MYRNRIATDTTPNQEKTETRSLHDTNTFDRKEIRERLQFVFGETDKTEYPVIVKHNKVRNSNTPY